MLLNVQVEPHQGEGQPNRLVALLEILRGESIDDVLVNEGWVAVSERVTAKLLISFMLSSRHGPTISTHHKTKLNR